MKNLFNAIQITFSFNTFDNAATNALFNRVGYTQYMLPGTETSIQVLERVLKPFIDHCGYARFDREFTKRSDGNVTMIVRLEGTIKGHMRTLHHIYDLEKLNASFSYGVVKEDASFVASKNQPK